MTIKTVYYPTDAQTPTTSISTDTIEPLLMCVIPVVFCTLVRSLVYILTVEHNHICLYSYKEDIITTCFGPICVGHLQVVIRLLDQL